ncbi:MAG: ParB N-terminal domain-containing protein [bacterium]|nr:ParB N-terminal domain-containing protein [bacterium]
MELRRVEPGKLDLSLGRLRRLPEPAIAAMAESLRTKGQLSPLVAAERDGVLVLVDGFVRRLAAMRNGLDSMLVEVVVLSPVQMKAQLYLRNRERGLHLLEECGLVKELAEVEGLTQVEIGDALERHKSWVCRRLALVREVSPHLLAEMALGQLTEGCLRRLARLPARNQEALWTAAQRTRLTPRQTGQLVDLWRRAPDPEARQYVIEHPREALELAQGRAEKTQDARLGVAGAEVLGALVAMRRTSLRLARRLRDGPGELPPEGIAVLTSAHAKAHADCNDTLGELDAWLKSQGGKA